MVLSVSLNTYAALQDARVSGIIIRRDFIWITALNEATEAMEHIGLWSGRYPITVPVIEPSTRDVVNRVYQPMAGRMNIPPIPMEMSLKVRALELTFSSLSPAAINAIRVFNPRQQPIEIHRGLLDKVSRKLVDPAHVRWDGLVNQAPIDNGTVGLDGKANNDGQVRLQTVCHARWLTMASGDKMDAHFFQRRGDHAGDHISTIWRVPIPWGADQVRHEHEKRPKERFFR